MWGGMGAPELNFHAQVYKRMGYGKEVDEIGRLFMSGRKDDAAAIVPDETVTETMIIGDVDQVRADVRRWEDAGVTMLLVSCPDAAHVRELATAVQG
ncbi:alkanesulfonate monooxygenase SsuD/methylene tetrahydromethanopterin reductase-like flavin-dependent oxidoreductase (luciferase family) [Rhodococcus sp. 27YEA15]